MVKGINLQYQESHKGHFQSWNSGLKRTKEHSFHKEDKPGIKCAKTTSSRICSCYPGSYHPGIHPLVAWKIHHRVVEQPAHNQKNPNQSQYQFHGTEFSEVTANFSIQEQSINIIIVFSHFLELLLCLTVETLRNFVAPNSSLNTRGVHSLV